MKAFTHCLWSQNFFFNFCFMSMFILLVPPLIVSHSIECIVLLFHNFPKHALLFPFISSWFRLIGLFSRSASPLNWKLPFTAVNSLHPSLILSPFILIGHSWPRGQSTVGQNSQEFGCKYWATRLSVCSFTRTAHSFTCFALLASLVRSAALTRSLVRSLCSLPSLWDSEWFDG